MPYLIPVLILLLALYAPQFWAQHTFRRYAKERRDIPGSGAELARHLLDRFDMTHIQVERTHAGEDHYDPQTRTLRLGADNFNHHSLTAIAVAAHEVGHAIQHHRNEPLLSLRGRLLDIASRFQKLGSASLLLMPVIMLLSRSPLIAGILILLGLASMFITTLVHLVTLPVELDASFGKALPLLLQGEYINPEDEAAVRKILGAAAWTYVAASLASLLNVWRWLRVFRR
ncbi:MAG TPA: zinc metallopeptidase [Gammaproteobacteria bacterium]|nr:zinc metallopeptidase [Gammaproteobacteria bacterium]